MIYLIYFFSVLFVLMGFAMLYVSWRSRLFGLFLMGITYCTSGLLAAMLPHWWPLAAGFVLAWLLRALGLEPRIEPPAEPGGTEPRGTKDGKEGGP